MMKFKHPELVVPFRKVPLRDQIYQYVVCGAIALLTASVIIYIFMKNVC